MERLLSLDRLAIFYLAATHMSFTYAAREMHVTQPAITKRIDALERDCGHKLFERRPGSISLTEAGARLLPEAEAVYRAGVRATQVVRAARAPGGPLRLSAPQTWSSIIMRSWIPRLNARYPEIRIELQRGNYEDMLRGLVEERFEAALVPMGVDGPSFESVLIPMKPDPLIVLVTPDHELGGSSGVRVADLVGYPLMLRSHMPFRRMLDERAQAEGVVLNVIGEVSSSEDVCQAVLAGSGVGVVPLSGGRPALDEGVLRAVQLEDGQLLVTCHLVTLKGAHRTEALEVFAANIDLLALGSG